ncbi:benzoate 4-monooxygenase cytochrome P450 [Colletotrichum orchidophilum]|uniref:Benzoate 4-monooxygenase cytochrome P450 n=1 Tax=Colletotrichum orchidophilum TaxID=1209926 RepID=A0A1G4ASN9_9PEZI|nr:benzoate 4-monooxygenase cytochrome P450 [Colletotrichum orchidophilum]OHE92093.1 benzoate 4-monooxygenase cytochrome P450 [Colletotrichum orchidophilum]
MTSLLFQSAAALRWGSLAQGFGLVLVVYLLTTTVKSWTRLSHIPGPFLSSLSYWSMFRIRTRGSRAYTEYVNLSTKYGDLVRIGPNDLITSDVQLIRRMSAAKSTYGRSSWYKATRLDPYHDMMGSVLDKSVHHSLRTKLQPGYLGKDIPGLETSIDSGIADLVSLIQRSYAIKFASSTPEQSGIAEPPERTLVDFGRLAHYYAMDARSRMSFGQPLGLLRNDTDVFGLVAISNLAIDVLQFFTDIPPLQWIGTSDLTLRLFGPKPTDKSGFGKIMGLAKEHVAARFGPNAIDEPDLLGSFIRRGLDQRSAQSEIMFPMVAGSDTAGKAIKWTLHYILANQSVYKSLAREVENAIIDGMISDPISYEEAQRLPYLQAVIYESLRVRPPFSGLVMKQVGPDGDIYNGIMLPAGTRIGHDITSVTHNKCLFGQDADLFRPERWLEAEPDTVKSWKKQTELVFGVGRWQCTGKSVAFLELNKIFVQLIRNFEFQPSNAEMMVTIFDRRENALENASRTQEV